MDSDARLYNFKMPYRTPQEFDGEEEMSDAEWSVYVGSTLIQDGAYRDVLGKLSRYEAGLMKSLSKTLVLLRENRADRKGNVVMLEAKERARDAIAA